MMATTMETKNKTECENSFQSDPGSIIQNPPAEKECGPENAVPEDEEDEEDSSDADDMDGMHSSRLGTKDYWENAFTQDLQIYEETQNCGEVWFGISSIKRVADWLDGCSDVSKESSVLDIGCGNGMMLVELARRGYTRLTGIDYSTSAVKLAQRVAEDQNLPVTYEVFDILKEEGKKPNDTMTTHCQYDVCLDKGTYDAVSLNPVDARLQRERYVTAVHALTQTNGGIFIITSCNWTRDELLIHFTPGFTLVDNIPTPSFQFGGRVGEKETVLVFKRTT